MINEDNKKKTLDIPDVTTTFQSVALLEANDQAQVQDDETQKGCDDCILSNFLILKWWL